jgi:hypothetical protein
MPRVSSNSAAMAEVRISLLLDLIDQAFDHRAWHGTT